MAYAPDFANDVFVSFAHLDNQRIGGNPRWVSAFARDLETCLRMRLGARHGLAVFFDESPESGRHLEEALVERASRSAVFVAVTSPSYVARDSWGLTELRAFMDGPRPGKRLFPIEFLPLDGESEYPAEVRDRTRFRFWRMSPAPTPLSSRSAAYGASIQDFSDQVRKHLKWLHDGAGPIGAAALAAASGEIHGDPARLS